MTDLRAANGSTRVHAVEPVGPGLLSQDDGGRFMPCSPASTRDHYFNPSNDPKMEALCLKHFQLEAISFQGDTVFTGCASIYPPANSFWKRSDARF